MKERYVAKNFRPATLDLIEICEGILNDYAADGYDLTLRQLYYQLVSRDIIPNSQKEYSRLGSIVNDARLAGLLDWEQIVDRGRKTVENSHWTDPSAILRSAAASFAIDKWEAQPYYVEVMCEKQALEGVLAPVCERLDIPFSSNKGYSSQSFMWRKGKNLLRKVRRGKEILLLYLGDHDPSGLDMDRDIKDRLSMFVGNSDRLHVENLDLNRVALTMDQIEEFNPPPNPAKITDSRAKEYIKKHGDESWELDALEPRILAALVEDAVFGVRDEDLWMEALAKEQAMTESLKGLADEYKDKEW